MGRMMSVGDTDGHSRLAHKPLSVSLLLLGALVGGCGGGFGSGLPTCHETRGWNEYDYGQTCDVAPEECTVCPADSECRSGLVRGSAVHIGKNGTCARPCDSDADCRAMSFSYANGVRTTSERWSCGTAGVCVGVADYDPVGISDCEACRNTCRGQGSWCQCNDVC